MVSERLMKESLGAETVLSTTSTYALAVKLDSSFDVAVMYPAPGFCFTIETMLVLMPSYVMASLRDSSMDHVTLPSETCPPL